MRDPYTVLGVAKSASPADIKKAFRKLAKQYHPDQSKDPKAAARFAEINQANEILSDAAKRAQFDRGEIDAEGKPRFQGFEGFSGHPNAPHGRRDSHNFEFNFAGGKGGGFEDILSDMFGSRFGAGRASGRGSAPQGADLQASVRVPFTTWVQGGKVRVTMPQGRTLDVSIPAGIADGKIIRLKGQGEPSAFGGPAGDALISVAVEPDPRFAVEGRNIKVDVKVTVYEAALGAKVRVPTPNGSVEMTLPAGTTGERAFRLKGKGLPTKNGHGDLLVTPRIVLPANLPETLKSALKTLKDEAPYNPGRE